MVLRGFSVCHSRRESAFVFPVADQIASDSHNPRARIEKAAKPSPTKIKSLKTRQKHHVNTLAPPEIAKTLINTGDFIQKVIAYSLLPIPYN
jgi:hypothetical protein